MSGHGRGRGGGGRGGGGRGGRSGSGGYFQTQTRVPKGSYSGGRGGGSQQGGGYRGGGSGQGGQKGGSVLENNPHVGLIHASNWDGNKRGDQTIVIFGPTVAPPPNADIRKMEDGLKVGDELDKMFEKMRLDGRNALPLRPGYNDEGKEIQVYANYFPVKIGKTYIYKYNVAFVGPQPPQAKKGRLLQLLVEGEDLGLSKIPYRTNFRDIICTTEPINYKNMKGEGDKEELTITYIPEWQDPLAPSATDAALLRERQVFKVQITYDFMFELTDLTKRLDPREAKPLPDRVESIIQALNAMFNHNPYANDNTVAVVAKTGLNKYYDKRRQPGSFGVAEATFHHLGDGFEAIRGFIKSVRLGTGRILLNVNVATGVFVQPVSLAYYYSQVLSSYRILDKEKRMKLLRVGRLHLKKEKGGKRIFPPATVLGFARATDGQGMSSQSPDPKKSKEKRHPPKFKPGIFDNGGRPGPKDVKFCHVTGDGKEEWQTVFDYFNKKYPGFDLNPSFPVVNIGSSAFPSYVPLEAAIILPGNQIKGKLDGKQTAQMVNFACRKPNANATAITGAGREILGLKGLQRKEMLKLGIDIGEDMITVTARLLKAPGIVYASNRPVHVRDGSWNLANQRFNKPGDIQDWAWVWFSSYGDLKSDSAIQKETVLEQQRKDLAGHVTKFMKFQIELGMKIAPSREVGPTIMAKDPAEVDGMFEILEAKKIKWLLVILEESDVPMYSAIKNAGDVKYGINTVCVTRQKFCGLDNRREYNEFGQKQYFGNVSLKFNLKAGGTNNLLLDGKEAPLRFISENKTMIIGLDVTHPSPGSQPAAPSVAAMVANIDGTLGQWPGVISIQKAGVPGSAREMVDELKSMLASRLRLWAKNHKGALPENIIMYRDGISEGQYNLCLEQELPLLQEATQMDEFAHQYKEEPPRWTIIVCSKRHHTRFFPTSIDTASKTSNCRAGTNVDRDVTTPQYWEFFLQAHHCIQGTAKPCRYIVIKDEIFNHKNNIINKNPALGRTLQPATMLPYITNNMCHMFGRATKAVSLCPPAYYADILCERARVYLSGLLLNDAAVPDDPNDIRKAGKLFKWIRDFKPEEWERLSPAVKQHYERKAMNHRERLQSACEIHKNLKDSMFYV